MARNGLGEELEPLPKHQKIKIFASPNQKEVPARRGHGYRFRGRAYTFIREPRHLGKVTRSAYRRDQSEDRHGLKADLAQVM
jgi:hypothetical protein